MKQSLWSKKIQRMAVSNSRGFHHLLMSEMIMSVSLRIPTIAIKENIIFLNPNFCSKFSNESLVSIIKHEVTHALFNNINQMDLSPQKKVEILRKINLI